MAVTMNNKLGSLLRATYRSKIARECRVKPQSVQGWFIRNKVPAEQVLTVEKITGIARHKLRPDLYPPEEYELLLALKSAPDSLKAALKKAA